MPWLIGAAFIAIAQCATAVVAQAPAAAPRPGALVLGFEYGKPADVERLNKHTTALLALASCLNDFECRLSSRCLNSARPQEISVDGAFSDVLLKVPVRGNAHVEAVLKITTVPDPERAAINVAMEGTVAMPTVGHSQGMRIETDAAVRFRAAKLLIFDRAGMRTEGATCTAESRLTTKRVVSNRPKLFARIAETVALQRVIDSRPAAEAECSAHLAAAVRAGLDREIDALAAAANAALAQHLASASETEQQLWQLVRFRTDADYIHVTRHIEGQALLAAWKPDTEKPLPAIIVRLPRANLDLTRLLARVAVLDFGDAGATPAAQAAPNNRLAMLKPSLSWQPDALTVSLDFELPVRVAQEPSIGAGQ